MDGSDDAVNDSPIDAEIPVQKLEWTTCRITVVSVT